MKKRPRILKYKNKILFLGLTVVLIGAAVSLLFATTRPSKKKVAHLTYKLSAAEKSLVQSGDFILRRGYGFVSMMVARTLNEDRNVSHVGVLVREEDGIKVIHSLSSSISDFDGIQKTDFDEFNRQTIDSTTIIVRLKSEIPDIHQKIAAKAYDYLERQIPFDHKFSFEDTTKFYCSELLWHIVERDLKALQVDTLNYPTPESKYWSLRPLYDTAYFDVVLDHQH